MSAKANVESAADEPVAEVRAIELQPVAVVAAETVRVNLAAAMLGMTVGGLNAARADGRWVRGKHWHKSPDGCIWYDIPAIQAWIRTGQ
jgi:hypothetical protein